MEIFERRALIYDSIFTSTPDLEVSRILFNNLLNFELKSLIFSFGFDLRFDKSLIKVVGV